MERFFISGELNCRRIMSTRYGRIGISWTLRQRVGQIFPLRHKISGPNFWKKTISRIIERRTSSQEPHLCTIPMVRDGERQHLNGVPGLVEGFDEFTEWPLFSIRVSTCASPSLKHQKTSFHAICEPKWMCWSSAAFTPSATVA